MLPRCRSSSIPLWRCPRDLQTAQPLYTQGNRLQYEDWKCLVCWIWWYNRWCNANFHYTRQHQRFSVYIYLLGVHLRNPLEPPLDYYSVYMYSVILLLAYTSVGLTPVAQAAERPCWLVASHWPHPSWFWSGIQKTSFALRITWNTHIERYCKCNILCTFFTQSCFVSIS